MQGLVCSRTAAHAVACALWLAPSTCTWVALPPSVHRRYDHPDRGTFFSSALLLLNVGILGFALRRLCVARHGDASLCLAWAGEQRCLSAPQLRSHLSLYISFACALLLHACASFMQRARAFCKFLCSGGLRSPVAEWTGSTASHGMLMHVNASIMRNRCISASAEHGYAWVHA